MLDQLKIKNLTNILLCIFTKQSATKAELVHETGLSNSTVSSSVNSLYKLNLLLHDGMEDSIGGRRSVIYKLNKDYGQFIGVDLYKDQLKIAVTDCQNTVLQVYQYPLTQDVPTINLLASGLEGVLAAYPGVLGIGIGLDGQIDSKEQIVVKSEYYDWHNVHLKEVIERQFHIFTYIDHRVNGAAVREGIFGSAYGLQNYMCFYESSKEKAALILDKKICRGRYNYTGQMQNIDPSPENLSSLISFFDIAAICIGYLTPEYKETWVQVSNCCTSRVICCPEENIFMEKGMAAVAQKEWFQSIYFML